MMDMSRASAATCLLSAFSPFVKISFITLLACLLTSFQSSFAQTSKRSLPFGAVTGLTLARVMVRLCCSEPAMYSPWALRPTTRPMYLHTVGTSDRLVERTSSNQPIALSLGERARSIAGAGVQRLNEQNVQDCSFCEA